MCLSEIYLWHILSFMNMFRTSMEAAQREGTSIIEMPTILHIVHTSKAERLASKFVILKTKYLVKQILEDGPEEEYKEFCSMWKDFPFHA